MYNLLAQIRTYAAIAPVMLFLVILLASPAAAKTNTSSNDTLHSSDDGYYSEEIQGYEEDDDGDLVGHKPEEKTSYATILPEEKNRSINTATANATFPASNATMPGSSNSTAQPRVKVVPPKDSYPTALRLFRLIPPSIFENTIEGLREDEKQLLMDTGETEFWVMTALSDEELVIQNRAPEADTMATLKLFRANNGDTIIAMGVTAGNACALELWRSDAKGGIIPMPMPDEPAISEFLQLNRVLPQDADVSMLICLDPVAEGLEAKPLIWTPSGLDKIHLDTKVFYNWNGVKFVKHVVPLE